MSPCGHGQPSGGGVNTGVRATSGAKSRSATPTGSMASDAFICNSNKVEMLAIPISFQIGSTPPQSVVQIGPIGPSVSILEGFNEPRDQVTADSGKDRIKLHSLNRVDSELFYHGPGGFRTNIRTKHPPMLKGTPSVLDSVPRDAQAPTLNFVRRRPNPIPRPRRHSGLHGVSFFPSFSHVVL